MKVTIINNQIYIGGCNLADSDYTDLMIGWNDRKVADELLKIYEEVSKTGNSRQALKGKDQIIYVDDDSKILIDAGVKKQSIILRNALDLIDKAEEYIFIACQYRPNSITAKHLHRAKKRGVKVTIAYNHPSRYRVPKNFLHHGVVVYETLRTSGTKPELLIIKNSAYLHAKVIASEKSAIVGSHNLIAAGVNFGTTEIALMSNNPSFSKKVVKTISDQIA
jgi:phosphatidylserine/phosphatidylglycerophosphate/cardiolipin synthase-like enzyme